MSIFSNRLSRTCPHCHKQFLHRHSMLRHKKTHEGYNHQCLTCGKHFSRRDVLMKQRKNTKKSEYFILDIFSTVQSSYTTNNAIIFTIFLQPTTRWQWRPHGGARWQRRPHGGARRQPRFHGGARRGPRSHGSARRQPRSS